MARRSLLLLALVALLVVVGSAQASSVRGSGGGENFAIWLDAANYFPRRLS